MKMKQEITIEGIARAYNHMEHAKARLEEHERFMKKVNPGMTENFGYDPQKRKSLDEMQAEHIKLFKSFKHHEHWLHIAFGWVTEVHEERYQAFRANPEKHPRIQRLSWKGQMAGKSTW